MNTLSKRIRELRKERLWSQEQLAGVAGVDVRTIQRIEAGRPASVESLKAIAAAFNLDGNALLNPQPEDPKLPSDLHVLDRLRNGTELVRLICSADGLGFEHDNLEDEATVAEVGELMDLIHDWGGMASELTPSQRLTLAGDLSARLAVLEEMGIWLFGLQTKYSVCSGEKSCHLLITNLYVAHQHNPTIVQLSPDRVVLPVRIPPPTGFTA